MNLFEVVRAECVVAGAKLADKSAALRAVVRAAKQSAILKDVGENDVLRGLEERESLGTTGFGRGMAIPHCRLTTVPEFVVGLITVPDGVPFDAMDDNPVTLIVFIVAPERKSSEHIRLLSAISRILRDEEAVEEIRAGRSPEAVRESFLRHAVEEAAAREERGRSLIRIFVQDEDVFREILQTLTEIYSCSVAIVEAQNVATYLAKLPLFAAFWTDTPATFGRIIYAVLDARMVNETIRRIEAVTGPLPERTGIVVTVQELFYSAGALST